MTTDLSPFQSFLADHRVTEVECLVPDMAGVARGKILPDNRFLKSLQNFGLRIPEGIFIQTVTGSFPEECETVVDATYPDVFLIPDADTLRLVPWYDEPTAQVICDAVYHGGKPVEFSSRHALRRVLALYAERGWKPVIAPELEFYLVQKNTDADYPLEPPVGRSGRREVGGQAYGIDAVNEFDPIFEAIYDHCEAQNIDIDTLQHEEGAAQIEINFDHGEPLDLADQVFLFKRTVREVALQNGVYATFMAKPMQREPGSAMHCHVSLWDQTGGPLFVDPEGGFSSQFRHFIGGLQRYIPALMPLLAPNTNSYRRLVKGAVAPTNIAWGMDNRTTGFRVPIAEPSATRVECRVAGADANPYLAIAATLAAGYLGMEQQLQPSEPETGNAHLLPYTLPRNQFEGLARLNNEPELHRILGDIFVKAINVIRDGEFEEYNAVISSWERENLLLNV